MAMGPGRMFAGEIPAETQPEDDYLNSLRDYQRESLAQRRTAEQELWRLIQQPARRPEMKFSGWEHLGAALFPALHQMFIAKRLAPYAQEQAGRRQQIANLRSYLEGLPEPETPTSTTGYVGPGGVLVDKTTGRVVYENPQAVGSGQGFPLRTAGPGSIVYDAKGNVVRTVPNRPAKAVRDPSKITEYQRATIRQRVWSEAYKAAVDDGDTDEEAREAANWAVGEADRRLGIGIEGPAVRGGEGKVYQPTQPNPALQQMLFGSQQRLRSLMAPRPTMDDLRSQVEAFEAQLKSGGATDEQIDRAVDERFGRAISEAQGEQR